MSPPREKIIQIAYITTPDRFDDCLHYWQTAMAAGPMFLGDFRLQNQTYRGKPTDVAMTVALFFQGDVQIELIKQTNDAPGAYLEVLNRHTHIPRAGIFHHHAITVDNFDETYARLLAQGGKESFMSNLPGAGRLTYVDMTETLGHYIEFWENNEDLNAINRRMKDACAQWDGKDSLRAFESLYAPGGPSLSAKA